MTAQTYLILISDDRLALTVGAALEDRLARDGHGAVALVPASDRLGWAGLGRGAGISAWQAGPAGWAPQVIALYEERLLERLEALGLAAYVGVPREQERGIVHWGGGAGAILLPVASVREFVDAVADHTPWSEYAVESGDAPEWAQLENGPEWEQWGDAEYDGRPGAGEDGAGQGPAWTRRRDSRRAGGPLELSRKLAVAGLAGPLLVVGLPTAVSAATQAPAWLGTSGVLAGVADAAEVGTTAPGFGAPGQPVPGPAVVSWPKDPNHIFNTMYSPYIIPTNPANQFMVPTGTTIRAAGGSSYVFNQPGVQNTPWGTILVLPSDMNTYSTPPLVVPQPNGGAPFMLPTGNGNSFVVPPGSGPIGGFNAPKDGTTLNDGTSATIGGTTVTAQQPPAMETATLPGGTVVPLRQGYDYSVPPGSTVTSADNVTTTVGPDGVTMPSGVRVSPGDPGQTNVGTLPGGSRPANPNYPNPIYPNKSDASPDGMTTGSTDPSSQQSPVKLAANDTGTLSDAPPLGSQQQTRSLTDQSGQVNGTLTDPSLAQGSQNGPGPGQLGTTSVGTNSSTTSGGATSGATSSSGGNSSGGNASGGGTSSAGATSGGNASGSGTSSAGATSGANSSGSGTSTS